MAPKSKIQKEIDAKMLEKEEVIEYITKDKFDDFVISIFKRIDKLEALHFGSGDKPKEKATIQRTESFNDEDAYEPYEQSGLRMKDGDKIYSMANAIKILPPNLVKDGRHIKANIEAICGFKISDDMMDEVYLNYKHDPY